MKTIQIVASFILAAGLLSGCSKQAPAPAAEAPAQTTVVEAPASEPAAVPAGETTTTTTTTTTEVTSSDAASSSSAAAQ